MIARNYSANGQIPVKGTLKRFNILKRFNKTIRLPHRLNYWAQVYSIALLIGDRLT